MIEEIIREIKNNKKCTGCSASKYDNCECIYCGRINDNLKELTSKLVSVLQATNNIDDKTLGALFSVSDLGIKEIYNILSKYNVGDILNNKYKWLIDNKFGNSISKDDAELFINIINSNMVNNSIKNTMITILIRFMIQDKLDISNDKKKILIKYFTEMYMETKVRNPECIYTKLDNANGDNLYSLIRLNEGTVDNYLNKKAYAQLLMLIFHECTHTYQRYYERNGEIVNYLLLLQSKESIISKRYPNYYDDNYYYFSEESEARYMEYKGLLDYLNVLNLGLSKENNDYCIDMMKKEYKNAQNEARVLNGINTKVDEIFDGIELTIDELNRYPLLKIEYKIEDGKVVKKTKEEMENDYNNYIASTGESKRVEIDYLYSKILGEKVNEKST